MANDENGPKVTKRFAPIDCTHAYAHIPPFGEENPEDAEGRDPLAGDNFFDVSGDGADHDEPVVMSFDDENLVEPPVNGKDRDPDDDKDE
jgi:hypothetical protein